MKLRKLNTPLSTSLPRAILQAVSDARHVMKCEGYKLDMSTYYDQHLGVCRVCIAGACLLRRPDRTQSRVNIAIGGCSQSMQVIDRFRSGHVYRAIELWMDDLDFTRKQYDFIPPKSPTAQLNKMERVAKQMIANGDLFIREVTPTQSTS